MSEWTALNVEYANEHWGMPHLELSRVNAFTEDEHGGEFDLLLDVFQWEDSDFIVNKLCDIAIWHGNPETAVLVEGSDTSDLFTFKEIEIDRVRSTSLNSWTNRPHSHRSPEESVLDDVADEVGLRPSWGGNYREYEE